LQNQMIRKSRGKELSDLGRDSWVRKYYILNTLKSENYQVFVHMKQLINV